MNKPLTILIVLSVTVSVAADLPPELPSVAPASGGDRNKSNSRDAEPSDRQAVKMNSPAATVRAFIAAHYAWNVASNERIKPLERASPAHQAAMRTAKAAYGELIKRLCVSSVVPQGTAFGDNPSHHPERESIESEAVSTDTAIVKTRNVGRDGFESRYEYHLSKEAGEWRIASLLYVNGNKKYESL